MYKCPDHLKELVSIYLDPFRYQLMATGTIVSMDLTKWVEVKFLSSGKAEEVADFFAHIFLKHGAPETAIKKHQQVTKLLNTNHKTTTAFHPQKNGQVERLNHCFP